METTLQQTPIKKKMKNNNKDKGYQLKLFARMLWVGVGFRGVWWLYFLRNFVPFTSKLKTNVLQFFVLQALCNSKRKLTKENAENLVWNINLYPWATLK